MLVITRGKTWQHTPSSDPYTEAACNHPWAHDLSILCHPFADCPPSLVYTRHADPPRPSCAISWEDPSWPKSLCTLLLLPSEWSWMEYTPRGEYANALTPRTVKVVLLENVFYPHSNYLIWNLYCALTKRRLCHGKTEITGRVRDGWSWLIGRPWNAKDQSLSWKIERGQEGFYQDSHEIVALVASQAYTTSLQTIGKCFPASESHLVWGNVLWHTLATHTFFI